MRPRVAVVVLSFNGISDTVACLENLVREKEPGFDIIVVDNASSDGAPAIIKRLFPDVFLIELDENRGWAGGNNVGISRAIEQGAELICLLNNDTTVAPSAITEMAEIALSHAPCLLHPSIDYADPLEGAQLDPSKDRGPGASIFIREGDDLFELNFAYGACLMVSAELFRRIGMFDERFFLQLEETDFWMRARRIGYRSLCTTRVRIIHAESRSFGGRRTPVKTYYIVRNTLLLIEKHHRAPLEALYKLRALYWSLSHIAVRRDGRRILPVFWFTSRDPFLIAARAAVRDYLLRRFGAMSEAAKRAIDSARS